MWRCVVLLAVALPAGVRADDKPDALRAEVAAALKRFYEDRLNSPFIRDQARATAQRLLGRANTTDAERIGLAYRLCYAREASAADVERAPRYLAAAAKDSGNKPADAWTSFCQVLIASAEFRHVR